MPSNNWNLVIILNSLEELKGGERREGEKRERKEKGERKRDRKRETWNKRKGESGRGSSKAERAKWTRLYKIKKQTRADNLCRVIASNYSLAFLEGRRGGGVASA